MSSSIEMQSSQDLDHLKLLTIFHYVAAGLMTFVSFFPVVHLAMGIAILNGWFDNMAQGQAPPREAGWAFIAFASILIIVGLIISACVALAGRRLQTQRSYTFCLVMAAIECLMFPIITALGVFTIIVLSRPSVKERFESPSQP